MDRKALGLDAERGDALFKCVSWDIPDSAGLAKRYARTPSYSSLEKKFPEPEEAEDRTAGGGGWKEIARFVEVAYETDGDGFARRISEVADVTNMLEYWLFVNLTMAADNTWKNTYYAVIDGKIHAFPWDLDITLGMGWNGDSANNYLYEQPGMWSRTYDFQAGRRLLKYVKGSGDYVRERYAALCAEGIASADALIADAEEQWALLHDSGAWARNLDRWPNVSVTDSLDYFRETVRSHETFFREYLETLP